MLLDEPQANAHLLLHCCARSTGSVALIFAPALPDIRGGRIRGGHAPSAEPFSSSGLARCGERIDRYHQLAEERRRELRDRGRD